LRIYVGLGFVALIGLVWLMHPLSSSRQEPVYAGKTADQWLNAGYEDASQALQQIGPPAVPFILAKLAREDPRYGSQRNYHELWNKLPTAFHSFLPRPKTGAFDELHACSILLELGPGIIQLLSSALKDKNPVVREVSAHVLGSFRLQSKDISKAAPALVEALRDPVAEVRARAAWALGKGGFTSQQQPKSEIRSPNWRHHFSDFALRASFDRILLQPALDRQATPLG